MDTGVDGVEGCRTGVEALDTNSTRLDVCAVSKCPKCRVSKCRWCQSVKVSKVSNDRSTLGFGAGGDHPLVCGVEGVGVGLRVACKKVPNPPLLEPFSKI